MRRAGKWTALACALAMVTVVCGCSGTTAEESGTAASGVVQKAENCAYDSTICVEGSETVSYSDIRYLDGTPYVLKQAAVSDYDTVYSVCSYTDTGKETACVTYDGGEIQRAGICDYVPLPDGAFALLVYQGENPDMAYAPEETDFDWDAYRDGYTETYEIQWYDADGTLQNQFQVNGDGVLQTDGEGDLLFFTETENAVSVQRLQPEGVAEDLSGLGDLSALTSAVSASDGSIIVYGEKDGGRTVLRQWRDGAFSDMGISLSETYYGLYASADETYLCYLWNGTGIFGMDSDGGVTEVLELSDSNLTDDSFWEAAGTAEGAFYAILYDDDRNTCPGKLTVKTETEEDTPITLTLAVYSGTDGRITSVVSGFNRSQDAYKVEIVSYAAYDDTEEGGWTKGRAMFDMDIAAGNIPDLVLVDFVDMYAYGKKGLFLDLYDCIDSDETCDRTDFLQNFLTANEVDGSLYWLTSGFQVSTILANTQLTGGLTSWSLQEFTDICQSCDEQGIWIDSLWKYQNQESFIGHFLYTTNSLFDCSSGACAFDSDAFVNALRLSQEIMEIALPESATMTDEEYDALELEMTMLYQNGESLLMDTSISGYEDYALYQLYFGDQPVAAVGYPSIDGESGSLFNLGGGSYGITSACDHPEGAWEFIKYMTEHGIESTGGFPVLMDALEENLQDSLEMMSHMKVDIGGMAVDMPVPTQEEMAEFLAFLESVERVNTTESSFADILEDVMADFYSGAQTAEETAQILQQRCSLYFEERG